LAKNRDNQQDDDPQGDESPPRRSIQICDAVTARVVECIARSGKKQREIAEGTGIPAATISTWMNGHRQPGVGHIALVAEYLGISVEIFYEGSYRVGTPPNFSEYAEVMEACKHLRITPSEIGKMIDAHINELIEKQAEAQRAALKDALKNIA
jgi:transcriptional regulator with XRE-family HTH domain